MSMKAFVAGHRGLVGRNLCESAPSKYEVITSEIDLRDKSIVKAFLSQHMPDVIVLAAARVGGIAANSRYQSDFLIQNLEIQNSVIGAARELEINKENNDIHSILEEAIEHINLIIEDRKGTITKHFDATRTTVLLNDVHFTNVIVNILDNAIKYSPEIPEIDIYTENIKDFIIIKIKDHGSGMSKVAQKRIFEKFYREHTGDLHNVKGHGLGLAYVKKIVDNHDGEVYVESEKGKGSIFIIKLPLIN